VATALGKAGDRREIVIGGSILEKLDFMRVIVGAMPSAIVAARELREKR
jgi:hypothetical protein